MTAATDHVGVQARLQPDRLAAADLATGRRWSYRDLDRAVAGCARVLRDRGCRVGDRIAAVAHNRVELIILHLACARIGAIYAPLNWRLSPPEILMLLEEIGPALVVGDHELGRAGVEGLDIVAFAAQIDAADTLSTPPIDPDRPSLILFTSGTSGHPKGAMLSEGNCGQTAINFGRLGRVTHQSVFLVDSPMFHVIGLITCVRPALLHGAAILVSEGFEPTRTLSRMADPDLGVSHYFCVPQMAASLRADPSFDSAALSGLEAVFTGGAPHPAHVIREWLAEGICVVDGFGMTEAGTVFGMPLERGRIEARAGSAGVAMPSVRTRIVDDQDRDCPAGTPGELLLKGPGLFSGYWRRPEETARAFTAGGWFRTGDVAVADEDGFHWLVDRTKDMFISGGENVYPAEVEAALLGHPLVAECAVVGLPDARWGEVGHAVVVLRPGSPSLSHAEVIAFLDGRLARYKMPKGMTLLDALPRSGSGKVLKRALREQLGKD